MNIHFERLARIYSANPSLLDGLARAMIVKIDYEKVAKKFEQYKKRVEENIERDEILEDRFENGIF